MRLGLIATLALLALALAPAALAAKLPPLGKPPKKCGAGFGGGSGCYGRDVGPGVMDDMNQAELTISPHLIKIGQPFTVRVESVFGDQKRQFSLSAPANLRLRCPTDIVSSPVTCTGTAIGPESEAWQQIQLSFSGGVEQDYYAVRGRPPDTDAVVTGRVTRDGKPLQGATVEARRSSRESGGPFPSRTYVTVFGGVTAKNGGYRFRIPKRSLPIDFAIVPDFPGFAFDPPGVTDVKVVKGAKLRFDFAAKPPKTEPFDPQAVARVTELKAKDPRKPIKAEFVRDGQRQSLEIGTDLRPGDQVLTDKNSAAAIELDLGGRVAVRPDSQIELTGERSVTDKNAKFKLTKGGVWAKCGQMKESLEIQTTGGVMGIKG